ncbi:MAG: hypothetical protein BWK80_46830 [Desulfobacteraceae bacterium IS3]|nr:MAG: hypothetical protein BWK80_46830 [Desulfobacteraceae bacterium IS3]
MLVPVNLKAMLHVGKGHVADMPLRCSDILKEIAVSFKYMSYALEFIFLINWRLSASISG